MSVRVVELPGIAAVQFPQCHREARIRSLDDQVVVVAHQAVRQTEKLVAFDYPTESLQENLSITVIEEQRSPIAASRGYVVDPVWDEEARRSRHARHPRARSPSREGLRIERGTFVTDTS